MSRTLMGRTVPDDMFHQANGVFARGGRAFVCLPEGGGDGSCNNCNGAGHFVLQIVVGGPFDSAPSSGRNGTVTTIDGKFYLVQNNQHDCPICLGTSNRRVRQRAENKELVF